MALCKVLFVVGQYGSEYELPKSDLYKKPFLIEFQQNVWKLFWGYMDMSIYDRLCGLVVRVPGYRSRDPAFDSQRYQFF
jgi:hypothetical protein